MPTAFSEGCAHSPLQPRLGRALRISLALPCLPCLRVLVSSSKMCSVTLPCNLWWLMALPLSGTIHPTAVPATVLSAPRLTSFFLEASSHFQDHQDTPGHLRRKVPPFPEPSLPWVLVTVTPPFQGLPPCALLTASRLQLPRPACCVVYPSPSSLLIVDYSSSSLCGSLLAGVSA